MAQRKSKQTPPKMQAEQEKIFPMESVEEAEAPKEAEAETESKEEPVEEVVEAEPAKQEEPAKPEPKKPYVHIDTFLSSIQPIYNLSAVKRAGFKAYMSGSHYVRDESYYLEHLKKYLNIK